MFATIHHRPVEEAIIAAEELDTLERALNKAARMSSKRRGERERNRAYFLANCLGMSQEEIALLFGITQQAVSQRIKKFERYLWIACHRSPE